MVIMILLSQKQHSKNHHSIILPEVLTNSLSFKNFKSCLLFFMIQAFRAIHRHQGPVKSKAKDEQMIVSHLGIICGSDRLPKEYTNTCPKVQIKRWSRKLHALAYQHESSGILVVKPSFSQSPGQNVACSDIHCPIIPDASLWGMTYPPRTETRCSSIPIWSPITLSCITILLSPWVRKSSDQICPLILKHHYIHISYLQRGRP